ncbi:class I SAM-dependent methyltransferase [Deinococcus depolymerans]|uniref:class I SAM-dependent methyltransferase n=1 Tax=Deinococcus depolymerans TaxID=392408 RepID=UPI0031E02D59
MNPVPLPAQSQENLNSHPAVPALSAAQRSNLFPLTAAGYAWWRQRSLRALGADYTLEREARLFRARCSPRAGQRWLDVGTSAGFYAGVLARAGCEVLAVDISAPMLREGARREPDARIDWAQLNMERSDLPTGAFDGVTVGATLNETRGPAALLRECARVLRPGGQLWLMYLRRTGGPLQALFERPAAGGLNFPDPAWVQRQLPGLTRTDALAVGAVQFERYVAGAASSERETL